MTSNPPVNRAFPARCGLCLSLSSAAALIVAYCCPSCGWLAWFALVPWAISARLAPTARTALWHGVVAGLLFYGVLLDWIRTCGASHDGIGSGPFWIGWLLLSAWGACVFGLQGGLVWWMSHRCALPFVVTLPLAWWLGEAAIENGLRMTIGVNGSLTQLAVTQVSVPPVIQVADLGGAGLVTWFVSVANGLCADAMIIVIGRSSSPRPVDWMAGSFGMLQLLAVIIYGFARLPGSEAPGPRVVVFPQPFQATVMPELSDSRDSIDLAVWPEDAIDLTIVFGTHTDGPLVKASQRLGCPVLVGCRKLIEHPRPRLFNSLVLVNQERRVIASYDKRFLTPGLEFAPPLRRWFGRWWPIRTVEAHYSPGLRQGGIGLPWRGDRTVVVGCGICHDACFSEWSRDAMRDSRPPDFFILCGAERFDATRRVQHLLLACTRLRAVECRRAIVRCVDNGYSGLIDPRGDVRQIVAPSQTALVVEAIPFDSRTSVFVTHGATAHHLVILMNLIVVGGCRWSSNRISFKSKGRL